MPTQPRHNSPLARRLRPLSEAVAALGVVVSVGGCAHNAQTDATAEALRQERAPVAAGDQVDMEEVRIVKPGSGPGGLDSYDAKTLFERGQDLLQGQAYQEAAPYFERVVREFPKSIYVRGAHFSRGLCYLHTQRGQRALNAFDTFLALLDDDNPSHKPLEIRGRFRRGAALALLGRYEDVAEAYDLLLVEKLSMAEEVEALTDSGIGHFMRGDHVTAEYRFMKARRLWKKGSQVERLGVKFFVAQATFYLGELARIEYANFRLLPPDEARRQARLDREREAERALQEAEASAAESVTTSKGTVDDDTPLDAGEPHEPAEPVHEDDAAEHDDHHVAAGGTEHAQDDGSDATHQDRPTPPHEDDIPLEELIGKQLEKKCQLLLRAQVAFLRVIREGHVGWASAAGYKVGTMYEDLYDEMVALPAPEDLTDDQRKLYREVMQDRIHILLTKALQTWEATAQMATRTGANNEWIGKTRASLDRLRAFVEAAEQGAAKAPRQLDDDEKDTTDASAS